MRRLCISRPIRWSPDTSFRDRDKELGKEFLVEIYAPDGRLVECSGDVLRVLSAFGTGATVPEVCRRLGVDGSEASGIGDLADWLEQRRFLRPVTDTPASRPRIRPSFLVSAHACGATLLRWLLDAHESIACAPPHRLALPLREMMERAAQTDAFRSLDGSAREASRSLARRIDELLQLHAGLRQKDGWVWSSRDHDLVLHFLSDLFEGDGRFICLVRHPLDAVDNAVRRYGRYGWHAQRLVDAIKRHDAPDIAYAHYFSDVYGRVRRFRDTFPERTLVVRYEDLVEKPAEELARICNFVGAPESPSLQERAFETSHEVLEGGWESLEFVGAKKLLPDFRGGWRKWPTARVERVAPLLAREMAEWGYEDAKEALGCTS